MLYLASRSPRRRELLGRLGLDPHLLDLDIPEVRQPGEPAFDYVRRVAREKAGAGLLRLAAVPGALVLAADTEVVLDDEVFGKPADADDAVRMLSKLSGRTHQVVSVVWLVSAEREAQAISMSDVTFAALTPGPEQADVTKSVQSELRRVGCLAGDADGKWNNASQRSLTQFNRYAGTKLDTKVASVDTLDTIKLKSSRVCPLVCEHGFKAEGDRCSKIVCAEGSYLNDDNECEKRRGRKPVASRDRPEPRPAPEARPGRAPKQVTVTRTYNPNAA